MADGDIVEADFEYIGEQNEQQQQQQHGRLRSRLRQTVSSSSTRLRKWMQMLVQWQRKYRKSWLVTIALALSLLTLPKDPRFSSFSPLQVATSTPPTVPIERVVPTTATTKLNYQQLDSALTSHIVQAARGGASVTDSVAVDASTTIATTATQGWQPFSLLGDRKNKDTTALEQLEQAVEESVALAGRNTRRTLRDAMIDLNNYMQGPKSDTLWLLLATALITPLCKRINTSPILGFLTAGMLLGPNGCGLISGIHTTETLAELGIVFFLFEMGIELSVERLLSMRKDVFGLGLSQFLATAVVIALVGGAVGGLPANALVVLGGGLALSSSAFVLQLLKDKNQLATRFGKAAFGVLLFQDLAVVPLLVVTPILAGSGQGLAAALGSALVKATLALGSITLIGRFVLNPLFKIVAQAQSQEAFLGVILLTVLGMSFMTEGLGLSNTLGAFLAGVLLSETKYRYQVEADIAPFRGVLLGLFFVTVGFEIDVNLIASNFGMVGAIVAGILLLKALITAALSYFVFGLSLANSQQTGLIVSQGGEFAFVAFGLARSLGIFDVQTTKLLLTCVSLTMAVTPFLSSLGSRLAKQLEEKADFTHYLGQDRDANEIKESDDFVVVVGYGVVGKVVCDLLDRKFVKYVGLEIDPNKAIQARNAGLPIFYGDISRQEVAEAFNVGKSKAVIVCISDRSKVNRTVIALRRWYPKLKIFARAVDAEHANRLQNTLNVIAMVPILPEDNLLLTLPFGGAVMKSLGIESAEVNAIVEQKRKELLSGRGLDDNEEELALLQLGIKRSTSSSAPSTTAESGSKSSSGGAGSGLVSSKNATINTEATAEVAKEAGSGVAVAVVAPSDDKNSNVKRKEELAEAAAERIEAAKQKSPFVAQVIEEVCPQSAVGDDETDKKSKNAAAAAPSRDAESITNSTSAFQ